MADQNRVEGASVGTSLGHKSARGALNALNFARRKPLGAVGLLTCATFLIIGLFANVVSPYDPNFGGTTKERLQGPSAKHWFGTDELGRDMFSRVVSGTTTSLKVAFACIAIGSFSGFILGIVSGYFGGWVDLVLQRITESLQAFPGILLALTLVAVLGGGLGAVIIAISVAFTPGPLRVIRGVVLSAKQNVYVDAARVIGASNVRIMLRHILPNVLPTFLVLASVALGGAILVESSLSFLGLGVPPPNPSWGRMLSGNAQQYALAAPWMVIFPGAAISLMVLGFNLLGDALRDIWDPRLRGR